MSLVILADDLTGAADCAARCRHAGLPTTIALRAPSGALPHGACALSSDSRWLAPEGAARRVYDLIAGLPGAQHAHWYKKIDSTLRGNIGAELDAMLDALGRTVALICPAFPAQGRGLRDGRLVAPPPAEPIDFPALLTAQSRRRVAAVGLTDVRSGAAALAHRFAEASQAAQLLVVDALTEGDLDAILEAAELALPGALLSGSAGLVGALARRRAESAAPPVEHASPGGPALIVVGSGSAMAQRQIAHMRQHESTAVIEVRRGIQLNALTLNALTQFSTEHDVLLHLPPPPDHAALDGPPARELAARLADAALEVIGQLQPGLLILAGGDTAGAILDRLEIAHLGIVREVAPGMPLTRGKTARGDELYILLKAGNHGDEATLVELLRKARMQNAECRM
jgi:D-threonate/D-erythronate kinase